MAGKSKSRSVASEGCPFCLRIAEGALEVEDELSGVLPDRYPLTSGHRLVVTKRHIDNYFALRDDEKKSVWIMIDQAKALIDRDHHPDGYNVGINAGGTAGQTIPHVHVHVIPRYQGDRDDPRGGVRWVIPGKARYWDK